MGIYNCTRARDPILSVLGGHHAREAHLLFGLTDERATPIEAVHAATVHTLGEVHQIALLGAEAVHDGVYRFRSGSALLGRLSEGVERVLLHARVQVVLSVCQELSGSRDIRSERLSVLDHLGDLLRDGFFFARLYHLQLLKDLLFWRYM